MKVIQNILAINFILCLARHWLSNLRHQGTRCIGGEKIKGVGGGGNIPSSQLFWIAFYLTNSRGWGLRNHRFLYLGSVRDPVGCPSYPTAVKWCWLKDRTQHIGGAAAIEIGLGPRTEEILFIRKKLYYSHRTGCWEINGSITISVFLQLEA